MLFPFSMSQEMLWIVVKVLFYRGKRKLLSLRVFNPTRNHLVYSRVKCKSTKMTNRVLLATYQEGKVKRGAAWDNLLDPNIIITSLGTKPTSANGSRNIHSRLKTPLFIVFKQSSS